MSRYRATWHLNEFTLVHTVRYLDPKNGKRFAAPYKTKEKAQAKMDQLKRDGVKDISITQDTLRGNIKFKEGVFNEDTDNERLANLRTKQMMKQTQLRDLKPGKDDDKITMKKNDIENIQIRMDNIKDKMQKQQTNEMLEIIDEEIKSDDDYQAKKKALQDIQNDPKAAAVVGREKLIQRKDKLQKDYAAFKAKMVDKARLTASADFEKDLVAEKPLSTKGATRKPTSKSDKLYLNNPKEFRRRNELENAYKQILNTMSDKEKNSKEGKIKAMDLARVRSAKSKEDLAKNMKHKGTLKIAEADLTKGQIKKVHKMADELPKKDFKDRYGKEKGDAVRYATATNIVKKKEGIKEMQQIDEKIKGIENKSEKSGIPYGILKQVYNRGMAAWKGGHRPGTTPQQWAMARVNAFITKGKAYYTADADLAKKARAAKKGK